MNINLNPIIMRNLKSILGTMAMASLVFISCERNDNDTDTILDIASAEEFASIREQALEDKKQTFQFNADDGAISLTSEKGVSIYINGSCLKINGASVTGMVDLEFVEMFDRGDMLTTNKPTMGVMPNGDKALLISGGEFYLKATQGNETIDNDCDMILSIPANLTGGIDNDMVLWKGNIDDKGDLAWNEVRDPNGNDGVFAEGGNYHTAFGEFGWTNVDRFYSDPRPKTQIQVQPPAGYDNTNSSVYLSYDGEGNALAHLDTFDADLNIFSEHYGQIPVGLECHVIFVSEDDGNWKYAIKAVTIAANGTIVFNNNDTATTTEAALENAINNLP